LCIIKRHVGHRALRLKEQRMGVFFRTAEQWGDSLQ